MNDIRTPFSPTLRLPETKENKKIYQFNVIFTQTYKKILLRIMK